MFVEHILTQTPLHGSVVDFVTFGYKVQPDNVRDVCLPCNISFIYNILSAMNNN